MDIGWDENGGSLLFTVLFSDSTPSRQTFTESNIKHPSKLYIMHPANSYPPMLGKTFRSPTKYYVNRYSFEQHKHLSYFATLPRNQWPYLTIQRVARGVFSTE